MALKTSQVFRCLDKKMLIFGFEIVDLFAIFSFLAILNLAMQGVPYKFCFTWGPAVALAVFLRLGKAGKPENYLLHLARFYLLPDVLTAFPLAQQRKRFIAKGKK